METLALEQMACGMSGLGALAMGEALFHMAIAAAAGLLVLSAIVVWAITEIVHARRARATRHAE
jgi:hypothetical protein